jgi:hypothetical protein
VEPRRERFGVKLRHFIDLKFYILGMGYKLNKFFSILGLWSYFLYPKNVVTGSKSILLAKRKVGIHYYL